MNVLYIVAAFVCWFGAGVSVCWAFSGEDDPA